MEHKSHQVTPTSVYIGVFVTLMILTVVTVAAAKFDLGIMNTPIALAIAGTKATVVILFFMEVRHAHPITKLAVVSGIIFLAILLILTFQDYFTRGWITPQRW